ncbi:hypothetical protein [Kitasatospora sp. NPDC017646]|uniref:hypothetical protein n=1 Tax=Kitasatospora sp. NPDC017646 TaxID=3364024 RepID=UPI00379A8F66
MEPSSVNAPAARRSPSTSQRTEREREQERNERALEAKRDQYARLNAAARAYRAAARDAVYAAERGEDTDAQTLDAAKEAWADQYAQAQMMLPKKVLNIVSDLNRSLGLGYSVVKQLPNSPDRNAACERGKAWFNGPLSDGVYLLRVTLRHDLGVEAEEPFEQTSRQILDALLQSDRLLADQLASERGRGAAATHSGD